MAASTVFGIDLGTTYSCISYVDEMGKPVVIPNEDNELTTPSVVYFESADNIIVGKIAKEAARVHPDLVVELVKRNMGDGNFRRVIHGVEYRPEEISALLLKKLKGDAERHLNHEVHDVVITVPAYFNEAQRTATEQAGLLAGFNVRGIIPEPTAAAVAYALTDKTRQTVLVYDLGGGTFDVTVMEIGDNSVKVICIGGDHDLGGRNWDEQMVAFFADEWRSQTGRGEDPLDDAETAQEFVNIAERAKKSLTRMPKVPVSLSFDGDRARLELTRDRFDELTSGLLERTVLLTRDTLKTARDKGVANVDRLILVGGSTYMPQVTPKLKGETGVDAEVFEPDHAVAKGAAIYAANKMVQDVYADVLAELFAGKNGTPADALPDLSLTLSDVTDQLSLPELKRVEEQVRRRLPGLSAEAIQAGRNMSIVNACSKNFGVVAYDNSDQEVVVYLIRKNSQVPAEYDEDFETMQAGQSNAEIRVMEAEGDKPPQTLGDHCKEIKRITFHLPPGLPKGSLVNIKYSLSDDGGRLKVKAGLKATGDQVEDTVETVDALSKAELEEKKARLLRKRVQ